MYGGTKKIVDFLMSFLALLLLSPFLILIALIIRTKLGSPVFFKQQRSGYKGEPFYIYKFRTMTNEKDEHGNYLSEEARLTPLGLFLRRFSLDELPQLWNVLTGDMSLIGPRPLFMDYLPLYNKRQAKRHEVKPGITGWAQVNGRNAISWKDRLELDVWYVENRSSFLDCKIVFKTVIKILKSEGISKDGHASMPFFEGDENIAK